MKVQYKDKEGKRHVVSVNLCPVHLKAFNKGKLFIRPRKGKPPIITVMGRK